MLEGEKNYLEVRVCPGCCPLGDAPLSPLAFLSTDASWEAAVKVRLLLVLTQDAEHLGGKQKAKLFLLGAPSLWRLLSSLLGLWANLCTCSDSRGGHVTEPGL